MEAKAGVDRGLRDIGKVDRIVHEPARLMILMVLYTVERADFTFLTSATELTDGNLSSHLSKLEDAGYVAIEKGYAGKKPRTELRLTEAGRQAVEEYNRTMRQALKRMGG
jgi:DNA-binding MarR family transcriptional regulator